MAEVVIRVAIPSFARDSEFYPRLTNRVLISAVVPAANPNRSDEKRFGFKVSPNTYKLVKQVEFTYGLKMNSMGFPGRDAEPKGKDEYRVMFLGDSATLSHGVPTEFAYPEQVEALAAEAPGRTRRLTAYNMGHMGYDTVQQLIVLRTYFDRVQPDHVVLTFGSNNDLLTNYLKMIDQDGNYAANHANQEDLERRIKQRVGQLDRSMLFRLFAFRFMNMKMYHELASLDSVMTRNCELLEEFAGFCRDRGVNATVVMYYGADAVGGGWHARWNGCRQNPKFLTAHCRARGIEVVDLLETIEGSNARAELFYPLDTHPNRKGYRKMAEVVFREALARRIQ